MYQPKALVYILGSNTERPAGESAPRTNLKSVKGSPLDLESTLTWLWWPM